MQDDTPPPPKTRREHLWEAAEARHIPLRAILTTVAVVALTYVAGKVVYRLRDVILLVVVAGFLALILNPLVLAVQRWGIRRRGLAVTVVTIWGLLVFAGLALLFGYPLVHGITHLADTLPDYVSKAQHGRGWIGHLVRRYHVETWVRENAPKLTTFGQSLAKPALTLGKGALSLLISLLTIFILVLLLLLEGPKLRKGLLGMMEPARAERYAKAAHEVNRSVTGYMVGNFLTSVIAGLVVYATLLTVGVPFPYLWGLWVALVDFLPMIGGALAGIPTVLFALTHSLTAGIVTLVVFLVYTQFENHVLNPIVMSKTVRVNPLLVLMSILIGASIGSWIGGTFGAFVAALLAIPAAGAVQVITREVWQDTAPAGAAGADGRGTAGAGSPDTAGADRSDGAEAVSPDTAGADRSDGAETVSPDTAGTAGTPGPDATGADGSETAGADRSDGTEAVSPDTAGTGSANSGDSAGAAETASPVSSDAASPSVEDEPTRRT
jgi:predicted PurR-regulated permease PerM